MTRATEALLAQAAEEREADGVVSASTEARLVEAGVILSDYYETTEE